MAHFDSETVTLWRDIIGRQKSSGVSMARFCREGNLSYWKFLY
jgi:hypothetical protein